jgi:antitoxin component of RelBE/YafQ-DinJ toxin-antitoxin module
MKKARAKTPSAASNLDNESEGAVGRREVLNNDGVPHVLEGDGLKVWDAIRWSLARQIAKDTGLPLETAEQTLEELRQQGIGVIVFDEEKEIFYWKLTELGKQIAEQERWPKA